MERKYKVPMIVWLKVTEYMHAWLQHELGCNIRVKEQRVVSIQHLPGAREALRMETVEDMMGWTAKREAMSARRRNVLVAGLGVDAAVMEREYGVTEETLRAFVPIEVPRNCMTRNGVLRPWTLDVSLGREQAVALQRVIRTAFWHAVADFDAEYARRMGDSKYPTIDMVEAFCRETGTPELYAEEIKREWNRRVKREAVHSS